MLAEEIPFSRRHVREASPRYLPAAPRGRFPRQTDPAHLSLPPSAPCRSLLLEHKAGRGRGSARPSPHTAGGGGVQREPPSSEGGRSRRGGRGARCAAAPRLRPVCVSVCVREAGCEAAPAAGRVPGAGAAWPRGEEEKEECGCGEFPCAAAEEQRRAAARGAGAAAVGCRAMWGGSPPWSSPPPGAARSPPLPSLLPSPRSSPPRHAGPDLRVGIRVRDQWGLQVTYCLQLHHPDGPVQEHGGGHRGGETGRGQRSPSAWRRQTRRYRRCRLPPLPPRPAPSGAPGRRREEAGRAGRRGRGKGGGAPAPGPWGAARPGRGSPGTREVEPSSLLREEHSVPPSSYLGSGRSSAASAPSLAAHLRRSAPPPPCGALGSSPAFPRAAVCACLHRWGSILLPSPQAGMPPRRGCPTGAARQRLAPAGVSRSGSDFPQRSAATARSFLSARGQPELLLSGGEGYLFSWEILRCVIEADGNSQPCLGGRLPAPVWETGCFPWEGDSFPSHFKSDGNLGQVWTQWERIPHPCHMHTMRRSRSVSRFPQQLPWSNLWEGDLVCDED